MILLFLLSSFVVAQDASSGATAGLTGIHSPVSCEVMGYPLEGMIGYAVIPVDSGATRWNNVSSYFSVVHRGRYSGGASTRGVGSGKHPGYDIRFSATNTQPSIYSIAHGEIFKVKTIDEGGWGKHIILKHSLISLNEPAYSLYAHLDSINTSLTKGTLVKKGSFLGKMGSTGESSSNHLHFQINRHTLNSEEKTDISKEWFPTGRVDVKDDDNEVEKYTYDPAVLTKQLNKNSCDQACNYFVNTYGSCGFAADDYKIGDTRKVDTSKGEPEYVTCNSIGTTACWVKGSKYSSNTTLTPKYTSVTLIKQVASSALISNIVPLLNTKSFSVRECDADYQCGHNQQCQDNLCIQKPNELSCDQYHYGSCQSVGATSCTPNKASVLKCQPIGIVDGKNVNCWLPSQSCTAPEQCGLTQTGGWCTSCTSYASFRCDGSNIYYYNSCGDKQEVKESCTYGCDTNGCLAKSQEELVLNNVVVQQTVGREGGSSYYFNGKDSNIETTSLKGKELQKLSAFAWIKPETVTDQTRGHRIISRYRTSSLPGTFIFDVVADGRLRISLADKGGNFHQVYTPSNTLKKDTWQHVGFIFDDLFTGSTGKLFRIYVNGQEVAKSSYGNGPLVAHQDGFAIGGDTATGDPVGKFLGYIDDVHIVDKALTQEEINKLYQEKEEDVSIVQETTQDQETTLPEENSCVPQPEQCNGQDNNCDGTIDCTLQVISYDLSGNAAPIYMYPLLQHEDGSWPTQNISFTHSMIYPVSEQFVGVRTFPKNKGDKVVFTLELPKALALQSQFPIGRSITSSGSWGEQVGSIAFLCSSMPNDTSKINQWCSGSSFHTMYSGTRTVTLGDRTIVQVTMAKSDTTPSGTLHSIEPDLKIIG